MDRFAKPGMLMRSKARSDLDHMLLNADLSVWYRGEAETQSPYLSSKSDALIINNVQPSLLNAQDSIHFAPSHNLASKVGQKMRFCQLGLTTIRG